MLLLERWKLALNLLNEQIEIVTDEPTLTIFLIESQDCKNDLTIDGVEFSELEIFMVILPKTLFI